MTPKDVIDELDTSHLETLLGQLEKLSSWRSPNIGEKHKQIVDYVKFLVAKATTDVLE